MDTLLTMSDLRIVLLGKSLSENCRVGNIILGQRLFDNEAPPDQVQRQRSSHKAVINVPHLLQPHLSDHQIREAVRECVSLSYPGPNVIVLLLNHEQCSTEDQEHVEKVLNNFCEKVYEHTMVITTQDTDSNEPTEVNHAIKNIIAKCFNRYCQFKKSSSAVDLRVELDKFGQLNSRRCLICGQLNRSDNSNKQQVTQRESTLTITLFGNPASVQFGPENTLLGEERPFETVETSRIVPVQRKIAERYISVINMIGLHETDSVDHHIDRLVNENEIQAFIFVVRLGQLTDADKMGLEWLERVFGDRVLQFVMILFTYETEEECDTIIDDLKRNPVLEQLLEKCGGRFHTCNKIMNNQSEMKDLMEKIERLFHDNQQRSYTGEIQEKEEMDNEHSEGERSNFKPDGPADMSKSTELSDSDSTVSSLGIEKERSAPTTTTETGETNKETTEQPRTEKERPDKVKEKENLFHRLDFDKLHTNNNRTLRNKLRAADILQLTESSLQSLQSCAEEKLTQTFIQKLLMMNYRARNIKTKEISEENHTQVSSFTSKHEADSQLFLKLMSFSNTKSKQSERIHPMDVQMAVFHCADGFLKQLMVTKLSQCQYALPLLVPDPFTQQIEFPLWTFRQINKSWKIRNTNNEIICQNQPLCKTQTPVVFFFRFGSVSSSKSQLMNRLINERHNTFFHRNCPGSSRTRVLMDGVVEIAWFCPSGSDDDQFSDCVAFCNLHGDAGDHEKQRKILTQMASVNVVLLECLDGQDRSLDTLSNLLKDLKPLICVFAQDESAVFETIKGKYKIGLKGRNQSDVSEDLRRAINDCLSESSSIFRLEDMSKHSDIRVDEEDDVVCRRGSAAAQHMMSLLKKKHLREIKESFLPHQGKLWHQWSQKNKELHRPRGDELEMEISRKKTEMKEIRQQQHGTKISEFMKLLLKEIISNAECEKLFFLKWLRILLDEHTSADLSALHHKYDKMWSTVLKLKENQDKSNHHKTQKRKPEEIELERISADLQASSFGLEHIMREIAQIYESCLSVKNNKKDLQIHFSSLPSLAAEMMISGFPLELMDGDAAHVPVIWISAVVDQLIQKLGDQRVFVLSVLGIQSSGKSTMLNAMFGLQFAVSAGRCTRGAFMQLLRVSDEIKTQVNFDYILVVDTEGLRALELAGRSTRHHDNELATFVVGLANLTLINIFGENLSEMQDILQIVVQAFLRMKKVRLNPSCVFVHQNVSDVTAGEKNMEGRRRLQETLDEMTQLAANEEECDAERFSDVIRFDVQNDVKYFAQLWEGNPPMAPPNPNYCENIQELKNTVLSRASESHCVTLSQFKGRINDLWKALLNENFVFSFKNILEIAMYRRLETKYSDWSWKLRSAMLKIQEKFHNRIANGKDEVEETDLLTDIKETKEAVQKSFKSYFEEDRDKEILSQWKNRFEIKITELHDDLIKRAKRTLDDVIQQKKAREKLDAKKTEYEGKLFCRSKELALQLKNTERDENVLKKEFDSVWSSWITELVKDAPPVKDMDFWKDVTQILSENWELAVLQERQHEANYKQIDYLGDYSDYVMLKRKAKPFDQDPDHKGDASSNIQEGLSAGQKSRFSQVTDLWNSFTHRNANEKHTQSTSKNNTLLKTSSLLHKDHDSVRALIRKVVEQTNKILEQTQTAKLGYNHNYIQEMTACVQKHINEYQNENKRFQLKKEFTVDLFLYVCELAHGTFTALHNKFKDANDPRIYLEKQKPQYYDVFKNYCKGATTTAIFAEFICNELKSSILQAVYNKTAIDLSDLMKSDVPALNGNRSKLEKHILKSLAEEENFEHYMKYIHHPKDYFKQFIKCEVNEFINQHHQTVLATFINNLTLKVQFVDAALRDSIEKVKKNKGDAVMWQKVFCETLTDELKFTGNSCVDLNEITDLDFLKKILSEGLTKLQDGFKSIHDLKMEKCRKRPEELLIDHLCQCCWVQCPFCKANCTNTIENHPGDHSVPFHRVDGVNGITYRDTTNLSIQVCTTSVASSTLAFYPNASDETILWREYRKADFFADWSISPDLSELSYWKWFVCRFQKDLEKYYKNTFERCGEIPDEWREHSKDQAIQSLDEYI